MYRRLRMVWGWLTTPPAAIVDPIERHQAQLLASLIVLMMALDGALLLLPALAQDVLGYESGRELAIMVTLFVLLGVFYALSRTPHHVWAARLVVILVSLTVLATVVPMDDPTDANLFVYYIVPVVLSSALLSTHFTLVLGVAQIASMVLCQFIYPALTLNNNWVGYVSIMTAMVVITLRHLAMLEEERRAELVQSKEQYQHLVERSPLMIGIVCEERLVYVNPVGARLLGAAVVKSLLDQPFQRFVHPDSFSTFWPVVQMMQSDPTNNPHEARFVRLDGEILDVEASVLPFLFEGSPATQIIVRDVTASKRAEAAEREQFALAEALRDTASVLSRTLELGEVLDRILDNLSRVIEHDAADVMLIEDGKIARVVACRGYAARGLEAAVLTGTFEIENTVPMRDVVMKGLPHLVEDCHLHTGWQPRETSRWVRSHIVAPIHIAGRVIGLLNVDSATPAFFTEKDLPKLQAFADQASVAIRNAQLFAAEREQRTLAEALRDTADAINTMLRLDDVFDRLLTNIAHVVSYDAASVSLIENGVARPVCMRGYDDFGLHTLIQSMRLVVTQTPVLLRLVNDGQPVVLHDTVGSPDWIETGEQHRLRSYLAVPFQHDDRVIGYITVRGEAPCTFSQAHAERLRDFASQAATAVRHIRLFAAEREQRALAEALRDIAVVINRSLDPGEVLDSILGNLGRVVEHDAANVMLFRVGVAFVTRSRGYAERGSEEWMNRVRLPLENFPAGIRHAIENQEAFISPDTHAEPEHVDTPETRWIRSQLVAPICAEGRSLGMLSLDSARPYAFGPEDGARLLAFADQVAVALENARLFDEMRRYADELEVLYGSTYYLISSLVSASDLSEVGHQIVDAVKRAFGQVTCVLWVLDDADKTRLVSVAQPATMLTLETCSLPAIAFQTRQMQYVPNLADDGRNLVVDAGHQSELVVPLPTSQGVVGTLDLCSPDLDAFTPQDQRTLEAFAERVGVALENRQLYAASRRYADELEQRVAERTIDLQVRNAVAETLSSSLHVHEMLARVLQTTVEQLGILGGAIYLLSDDANELQGVAHFGVPAETLGLVSGIIPGGDALPDVREETGISAVLSVPIWRQDQVQGVITLVHDQPRPWGSDETNMVDAIGRQIGGALANAQLYETAVRNEARLRTMLRSVADGLLVFDTNDQLLLINPAAERLFAFYPADRGGARQAAALLWAWLQRQTESQEYVEFVLPIETVIDIDDPDVPARCRMTKCVWKSGGDPAWPCWLRGSGIPRDDLPLCDLYHRIKRRAIQAHIAPVGAAGEQALGTVIVLHDVTYFRELEDLKGRFVSTVSHELRTPLTAMIMQVDSLNNYYDRLSDERRQRLIKNAHQQASVLRQMVEDILELSRYDARRARLQTKRFDLSAQCLEVTESLEAMLAEKNITLDMTQCARPAMVLGDPGQLTRAFRNLVSNAIKYTPTGGRITIRLSKTPGEVRLAVEDTGIGIAPEEQSHVFDRFFRAQTAEAHATGTGLGLAITKEIIDLHNGRLELASTPGRGSTFTIVLPVNESP